MKELVEFLASSLVDDPTAVQIQEKVTPDGIAFGLTVKREDLGKVIGKKGRTAKAMRSILTVAGARQKKRISLEILEPPAEETPTQATNE